jgi:hypothetical protein
MFVWTALSGWAAVLLLATAIAIPYVLRSLASGDAPHTKLVVHYGFGCLALTAAFIHAWFPMSLGRARLYNETGLLVATLALLVMLWQVLHGFTVRASLGVARRAGRRAHHRTMLSISFLVLIHVALNRA